MLVICAALGVVSGLGAILFFILLQACSALMLGWIAGYHPSSPTNETELFPQSSGHLLGHWALALIPALGGFLSGLIASKWAPEAAGHGTDNAIEAYQLRDGAVRARVPFVKIVTSALTIGSGGSGGSEGPITQIGAGFGSFIAQKLGLPPHERRTLMAAGMAAGIAAIFRAPLAGALFAAEIFYRDLDVEHEVLIPAFISSTIAYSVFCLAFGWEPVFATPPLAFDNPARLIPYLLLAFVEAGAAIVFIRVFYFAHDFFGRMRAPLALRTALGGLGAGLIGLALPQALGTSYGALQRALNGELTIWFLLGLAVCKMAATALSIGSGGSGGVFGPSVVIGGALGGAVGLAARGLFPGMHVHPEAFVIVGMASFFAAAANCPISSILLVSEVTGNFRLLVPSMLVCMVAYTLARRHSLYRAQLPSRLEAPSKTGNMLGAVLQQIAVARALERRPSPSLIGESMCLTDLLERFSSSDHSLFPVVDAQGLLEGVVEASDIRRALLEPELASLVVARDLARPAVTIHPEESLLDAITKLGASDRDELVVTDRADPRRPVATLNRAAITRAYDHWLARRGP